MNRVLLLGAGKIGGAIAQFLSSTGDYDILVADTDSAALGRLADDARSRAPSFAESAPRTVYSETDESVRGADPAQTPHGYSIAAPGISSVTLSASDTAGLRSAMSGRSAVISALSFAHNPTVAAMALESGLSYFDLTEDRDTTAAVRAIAERASVGQIFMPQCGLAPGFVSIAAYDLARQFDKPEEVRMRVGALPQFPTNEMKYNLTWSTDGLINEYGNPCEAIYSGRRIEVIPLEGLEHFSLDGIDFEAFNTSGGVGTLCETLGSEVRTLDYKTIRYRGHRDLIAFLMNELRLNSRRALLKDILENAIPVTPQDVVLIFCTVSGVKDGRLTQVTDARKIYHGACFGSRWSAIQITTAGSMCAVVDLFFNGRLPERGFVKQEQVKLGDFLANRFGKCYATGATELPEGLIAEASRT